MAFEHTQDGLKLYVATPFGIYVQSGDAPNPRGGILYEMIPTPDCDLKDIELVGPQTLVAACFDERSLMRIDLETHSAEVLYSADVATNGSDLLQPYFLAFDGESTILTGFRDIYAIDLMTGQSSGVVIEHGFEGATLFRDIAYGPDGQIYVSANPNIGILVLDRDDYSLQRILVPEGVQGMPSLGPLAFSESGELFLLSGQSTRDGKLLVEVERVEGSVTRTILGPDIGCCNGVAQPAFMVIRPE